MRTFNHQKALEALLILRGELGVSINDVYKITKVTDLEYVLYLLGLIEKSLNNSPLFLKYDPSNKHYFLALPDEIYQYLAEQELIKSILPKSVLATLACIIIELEAGAVKIEKLIDLRGKPVEKHLKTLQNKGFIKIQADNVLATKKLLNDINIKQVIKGIKED